MIWINWVAKMGQLTSINFEKPLPHWLFRWEEYLADDHETAAFPCLREVQIPLTQIDHVPCPKVAATVYCRTIVPCPKVLQISLQFI